MKFSIKTYQITAHCNYPSHGRLCRLRRSIMASDTDPAKGRPGGLLLAWLACASKYSSLAAHQAAGQKKMLRYVPELNFEARSRARSSATEEDATLKDTLEELERPKRGGEGDEPEGFA